MLQTVTISTYKDRSLIAKILLKIHLFPQTYHKSIHQHVIVIELAMSSRLIKGQMAGCKQGHVVKALVMTTEQRLKNIA